MTKTKGALQFGPAMHVLKVAIMRGFEQPAVVHIYELAGLFLGLMVVLNIVGNRLAHKG